MKLDVLPNSPWYAEGLTFGCTQCGNCCTGGPGYVWISAEEIRQLGEYLKISVAEVAERYCRQIGGQTSLLERRNVQGALRLHLSYGDGPNGCGTDSTKPAGMRGLSGASGTMQDLAVLERESSIGVGVGACAAEVSWDWGGQAFSGARD